jgi:hypothetical protein
MVTRGRRRASRGGRLAALAVVASLAALAVAGCGASSNPQDPRPAPQLEVSASVNPDKVQISPDKFGAGVVNFTVANLSGSPITFSVNGPQKASTVQIQPGAPDYLKMNLKEGTYQATVGNSKIKPATITVGPKRPNSDNQLLLP